MCRAGTADARSRTPPGCARATPSSTVSCHHRSRPSVHGVSIPVRRTTRTCSTRLLTRRPPRRTDSFSDTAWPRRNCPSVVITSLASASSMRAASADAEKPANTTRMQHAQPRARQHRDDRLGHHRHVDRDPITGYQPEVGQRVGGLADLGEQIRVRQLPAVAGFALPADRHPIAVAGLDVPVDAVVGDVELAADEPLRERRLRPVQHLVERRVPGQPVGLLRPERQPVGLGLAVQLLGLRWPARRTRRPAGRRTELRCACRTYL